MDNNDFRSKYIRSPEDIRNEMKPGVAKPGSKAYSEKEIVDKYAVSTATARKAKICPDIVNRGLTDSLYKVYEDYNIKITKTKQFLELAFLDKENYHSRKVLQY